VQRSVAQLEKLKRLSVKESLQIEDKVLSTPAMKAVAGAFFCMNWIIFFRLFLLFAQALMCVASTKMMEVSTK